MAWIIDETIPGWTNKEKLEILASYANAVPDNGWIVELGSLLGRSAYVLSMNSKPTVKLTCIDIWGNGDLSRLDMLGTKTPLLKNSKELFLHFTKTCKNISCFKMYWPIDTNFEPVKKADLVFIDADHSYKSTYEAIEYWFTRTINSNIIVDDYNTKAHEAVTVAVDDFCKKHNIQVKTLNSQKTLIHIGK